MVFDSPNSTAASTARSTPTERVLVVTGLAFEAEIARTCAGVEVLFGVGTALQRGALQAALDKAARECIGIVSFGTAGGLDPALAPGDTVIGTTLYSASASTAPYQSDTSWCNALASVLPQARLAPIAYAMQPVASAADKAALFRQSGAVAVDMESGHVAALAARHGKPFVACRVVIDRAARTIPPAALAGMREDGSTAIAPILRDLIRDPRQLAALIQLGGDASRARQAMRAIVGALPPRFALVQ